jgi:hypothetical protein
MAGSFEYCNETHQLLVYVDDVNLPGDNIDRIKKNTQTLIETSKGGWSRSRHRENYAYVAVSSPKCGQNQDIKIANRCFENVAQFRYLETTITNQNLKYTVFWYVAPCRSCVNRRFGVTYRLHLQVRKIRERGTSVSRWLYGSLWRKDLSAWSWRNSTFRSRCQGTDGENTTNWKRLSVWCGDFWRLAVAL